VFTEWRRRLLRPAEWTTGDWILSALCSWLVLCTIVTVRLAVQKEARHTVYPIFTLAAENWSAGESLYGNREFLYRYAPVCAPAMAPFAALPPRLGEILWRAFNLAIFAWGARSLLRSLAPELDSRRLAWLALIALPIAGASLNNGQVNLMLAGLLAGAVGQSAQGRWNSAAACLAIAGWIKLYPAVLAIMLVFFFPRQLGLRLALATAAGALLPFLTQRFDYVADAYRGWTAFLGTDFRMEVEVLHGNRDAWQLLRAFGLPLELSGYRVMQAGTAGAIGLYCLFGWGAQWTAARRLATAYALGTAWMLAFGPATESSTYTLVALLAGWALVDPKGETEPVWSAGMLYFGAACLLSCELANIFPFAKYVHALGLQPLGTILLGARFWVGGRPGGFEAPAAETATAEWRWQPA